MQRTIIRNGEPVTIDIPANEQADIRARWAQADAASVGERKRERAKLKRVAAIEKVLERLLEQNADIPEVAEYLAEREP